ncbi:MAG: DUF4139 domain-containing protein [Bacteroidia bacterium]|nr:DUF4139 domain-containing protein [Bacteroidia bacterium]
MDLTRKNKLNKSAVKLSLSPIYTKLFCFFLLIFSTSVLFAAEAEQRVPSNITQVTVFLNQAQVTRIAKTNLQAGTTDIVFDRISPYINLKSIQVKTENNVTLLSVSHRKNYLANENKPDYIVDLEDTLSALKNQLALLNIKKEALELEKNVILANQKIGGEDTGLKVDNLEDVLFLIRKRSQEIGEELLKIEGASGKLNVIRNKFQLQLNAYLSNSNSSIEVVVTVKTLSGANNTKIEWSYLVGNTSWKPFYDIRVKDTKSSLQLISKANITQRTGEDWTNVVLKLSNANPNENGTKPELNPLYLGYKVPVVIQSKQLVRGARSDKPTNYANAEPMQEDAVVGYSEGISQTEQTEINTEFNVTSAYTIPSDNNPHQVDLTVSTLNAIYAYGAVPKLDKTAFVTATVSGNELVNQVSGEANVYFDGTFTGKTFISGTASDSILLTLGRDKRIQIQRTLLKDFSSKTFSGSSKKELNTWEISLRNTRKEPITIVIEDQIPVSNDKEIEVKLLNNGGASFDEVTGKLKWTLTIDAEKSETVKFSFEVKYPKEKIITNY